MSYRTILWLAQQASRSKKAKNFFNMLKDPKKKARFLEKTKESKAYNRLKALKQKTGQEFMDFQKTGKIQKKLAGGLLYPGLRVAIKYARPLWKVASKKVYQQAGKTPMSKLQVKLNKVRDLQANFSKMELKDLTSSQIKEMSKFLPKLKAYKTKIKDTAKAWMEKEYRFGKTKKVLHSEGGEVVIGKNVDKDLL